MRAVGHLADGTPYFAPLGEVTFDQKREHVRCHLCGCWFRALAPGHLQRTHGWNHLKYKAVFGLTAGHALQVPALIEGHRLVMRRLLNTSPPVLQALALAQARQRAGDLDSVARPARRGPQPIEHRLKSAAAARKATNALRAGADRDREARARHLGYQSVSEYLRRRYVVEHAPLTDIKMELGTGQTTLARLLREEGL